MFHPNDKVGPYTLIRFLGRGGFGEVWLGEKDDKQFALKFPKAEVKLQDIEKEVIVWLLAKGHPNVLPIEGIDFHNDRLFIISEYAQDGSLKDWFNRFGGKAPSIVAAIEIMSGILDGLEYLHKRKIIHRDIKPANILLSNNTPRIADFGIAKFLPSETESDFIKGTAEYMSPEALDGERNQQTDLWSASVIFYKLLCGILPFRGATSEVIKAICLNEPAPLPETISESLKGFVMTALKKNPKERYSTAIEMRKALRTAYQETMQLVKEPSVVLSPIPKPISILQSQSNNLEPALTAPQPKLGFIPHPPQSKLQSSSPSQPVANPDLLIAPDLKSKTTKRVNHLVAGIVATLIVLSAITLGVVKLISNKPDTPSDTQAVYNPGGSPLKESKTSVGTFVQIPAGEFMMGSNNGEGDEKPAHKVKISKAFEIGKYEVTQAQWQAVMGANPSDFKGANLPVEQVSWNNAQEFIKKLNAKNDGYIYRLPTEAEWEYACRAGTTGDYAENLNEMGWYKKNSGDKTHPVGEKKPNAWGLYDMQGNVWEWCADWYDSGYYVKSPDVDPKGPESGSNRVFRGCGWLNDAAICRSAIRFTLPPDLRFYLSGFRLVRTYK